MSNVLKQWLQEHFEDFSHKMIEKLLDFINSTMLGAGYQKLASQLEELLRSKVRFFLSLFIFIVIIITLLFAYFGIFCLFIHVLLQINGISFQRPSYVILRDNKIKV